MAESDKMYELFSDVVLTLYLENTKTTDFEYRFDELIKFMQQWKHTYDIDEKFQIGTEKAFEVIWHPITRPYTVYARLLPEKLLRDNGGNPIRDPKNTFDFMSVNWFQVGDRLKLIFTHKRWSFAFPPFFDILAEISKDWQETRRDIWNYIVSTGQPFPVDATQGVIERIEKIFSGTAKELEKLIIDYFLIDHVYVEDSSYLPILIRMPDDPDLFFVKLDEMNEAKAGTIRIRNLVEPPNPPRAQFICRAYTEECRQLAHAIANEIEEVNTGHRQRQVRAMRTIEDPTDQRIWEIVKKEPSITDTELAQRMGNMTRQTANSRRRHLEKMGYKVRVSRQNK